MTALARKLLRDLWRTRAQVASIAAVLAGGVMTVVSIEGTAASLDRARIAYYAEGRFADVFASLTRAPDEVAHRLAAIPGVAVVETRVVKDVRLDVPGLALPGLGRLIALPDEGAGRLNLVRVLRGRRADPGAGDEVMVSGRFAESNRLEPGDSLTAVINERRVRLVIAGVAAAPDYLFEDAGAGAFSDERSFALLWAPRDFVASATGLGGAFNDVAIALADGASAAAVIAAVDTVLAPYGGRGAVGRADQLSHRVVTTEMHQLRVFAVIFPVIFVAVAAFLVGTVLSRLVATEREQVAILKAFGYTDAEVALHYLAYAALAVAGGIVLGVGVGIWLGGLYTGLYADILRIPGLLFRADWGTVALACLVQAAASVAGAVASVRRVATMPPAQALRPPAPDRYRALLLDRLGLGHLLSAAPRMVFRGLERRPSRALLGAAGVALASGMMAGALSLYDASRRMMEVQFEIGHRETVAVTLFGAEPLAVRETFAALPGVASVELVRAVPARIRHAGRSRTLAITGLEPQGRLHRLVDARGRTRAVPPDGLVLSASLAEVLGARAGDTVDVELLERGTVRRAVVAASLDELMSPNAYADLHALGRMAGDGALATGAYLWLDAPPTADLYARLAGMPRVAGVSARAAMLDHFERQMAEGFRVTSTLIASFAAVIALGVIYNGARIALSERGRELASLRVLGFTIRETGAMLLGEQAVVALAAVPVGWALGWGFAGFLARGFANEYYRIPLVTRPGTYGFATAVVLLASAAAGALMYRRVGRLDLVAVLKTRE